MSVGTGGTYPPGPARLRSPFDHSDAGHLRSVVAAQRMRIPANGGDGVRTRFRPVPRPAAQFAVSRSAQIVFSNYRVLPREAFSGGAVTALATRLAAEFHLEYVDPDDALQREQLSLPRIRAAARVRCGQHRQRPDCRSRLQQVPRYPRSAYQRSTHKPLWVRAAAAGPHCAYMKRSARWGPWR